MRLFCKHKYKIIDKIKVYDKEVRFYYDSNQKRMISSEVIPKIPIYHLYVLQCEKCGKIKKNKV